VNRAAFEIDHVFLCASVGAPEADRVIDAGFSEGSSNRHPGQGTANRRFFLKSTMLEFLWVEDEVAARSTAVRRLGLWERWARRDSGACPFGICLRPSHDSRQEPPFRTWKYRPSYSPVAIDVGVNSEAVDEPFFFYIPVARSRHDVSMRQTEPTDHRAGIHDMTSLQISYPSSAGYSRVMQEAEETRLVTFSSADHYLLHIVFDHAESHVDRDFRPQIPLTLSW
jgi:hypothetical protein